MQTKLTLRMERQLVREAKAYAKRTGRSVSQLVAEYFSILGKKTDGTVDELTPVVRSLRGVLKRGRADRADHRRHLEEKYL